MGRLRAIAAMSENRVIGNSGRIPWHLPADFRWFRQVTHGGILVMGRKTWESIGKPLPGRETFVLTRSPVGIPGVRSFPSTDALLEALRQDPRPAWVCGGGEVYSLLLPRCADLFLTRVPVTVEGDALFPPFERDFVRIAEVLATPEFRVEHWAHRATLIAGGPAAATTSSPAVLA
ncbi:MAG: dihydrofolate reductase [Verrucomicrobia bacterium]|nr:dihydrofolate reductase [Verrucomicrobiota bacterium]